MADGRAAIGALRHSHDRLAALVAGLDDDDIRSGSYCDDWTIAQVCSHLGSGAEIGLDWIDAAVTHRDPMSRQAMEQIWDKWNRRSSREQLSEAVRTDDQHVARLEGLSDAELDDAHLSLFGRFELDGAGLARFRLPEHALHTWDIAVALDPAARIAPDAVELLVDTVGASIGRLGRPQPRPFTLEVRTTGPDRRFILANAEALTLEPVSLGKEAATGDQAGTGNQVPSGDGALVMPAEALVRLVYGRLGAGNDQDVNLSSESVSMDDLHRAFPGT